MGQRDEQAIVKRDREAPARLAAKRAREAREELAVLDALNAVLLDPRSITPTSEPL